MRLDEEGFKERRFFLLAFLDTIFDISASISCLFLTTNFGYNFTVITSKNNLFQKIIFKKFIEINLFHNILHKFCELKIRMFAISAKTLVNHNLHVVKQLTNLN